MKDEDEAELVEEAAGVGVGGGVGGAAVASVRIRGDRTEARRREDESRRDMLMEGRCDGEVVWVESGLVSGRWEGRDENEVSSSSFPANAIIRP